MRTKGFFVRILATGCFIAVSMLPPSIAHAQADPRITKSMESLKAMTAKLGTPRIEEKEAVGGKDAPALYFGTTKVNNNFDIVDAIGKEDGKGMTATLFVKSGDEYIRVSTNLTADGRFWRQRKYADYGPQSAGTRLIPFRTYRMVDTLTGES